MKRNVYPLALLGLFVIASNCGKSTEPDAFNAKDGTAAFVASEVNDMGTSVVGSSQIAKIAVTTSPQVQVVRAWTFDQTKKVFVREINVTYPAGTRNRVDSVWFMGSNSDTLVSYTPTPVLPTIDQISSIHHKRTSSHTWNSLSADVELDMNIQLVKTPAETSMTKTGEIRKSRSLRMADQEWDAEINGVKRLYSGNAWSLPVEGSVVLQRTTTSTRTGKSFNRTVNITFQDDSTATVSVTRSYDNKRVDFTVDFGSNPEGEEK
jgi:hypothetical protein